jgi:hypothetical protein
MTAPTIKRNAAKKPLISGRRPDMTMPFGYRRDELLGQRVKNIIPDGFAERLVADGLRSAEDALAQQIGTGIELTGRRKDGSESCWPFPWPTEAAGWPSPGKEPEATDLPSVWRADDVSRRLTITARRETVTNNASTCGH